jgi:hypothetical protein
VDRWTHDIDTLAASLTDTQRERASRLIEAARLARTEYYLAFDAVLDSLNY